MQQTTLWLAEERVRELQVAAREMRRARHRGTLRRSLLRQLRTHR